MTNYTLEKPNDWWWLHSPLVISKNLAQIPTITPKVDLLSSIERKREHPKLRAKHTTHTIILRERDPPTGLRACGSYCHGGWSKEGLRRRWRFFHLIPIEVRRQQMAYLLRWIVSKNPGWIYIISEKFRNKLLVGVEFKF